MGVEVSVSIITDTEDRANEIREQTYAAVARFERIFSRFLPGSELSQLNVNKDQTVSQDFFAVLLKSYELFKQTNGEFNPLFQIARYGYDRDFDTLLDNTSQTNDPANYDTNFDSVSMDTDTRRVIINKEQKLDFGGVLKGYLAHKLSCNISQDYEHCTGNIVNIGGDLHTEGLDELGEPFVFDIFNPITKEEFPVKLTNTSLATSGIYKRFWQTKEGKRTHILSSVGKKDHNLNLCSASIIHKEGAAADAYAKLFLNKGAEYAMKILKEKTIKYFLVKENGQVETNLHENIS